jgi:flagellar hook-associated protein 2
MGGLISGTDVQGIIDKMMVMRGWRMQKMEEEKVECQADVAAWGDISASMTELTMALDKLRSFNTWRNMSCISSDPSKITATASTSAAEAVYTIEILQLAQSHSVGSGRADTLAPSANATTDLVAAGVLNEGDQFVIEGQTITIGASESLSSLRVKINNAAVNMPAATSVTATIMDDRLILMRTNTGSSDISIADVTGSALQTRGVLSAPGVFANELQQASDAIFTVNGVQITRSQNTNITDVIENVTLNLQEETVLPVKLTIRNDRETPKEAILDLVEKYNAAAEKLIEYGKISVSGDNNDGSLVAETGELWNDSLVKSILSNMRRLVTDSKYPNLNVDNST